MCQGPVFVFFFLTQDLLEPVGFLPQTTQRRKCARSPERTHATLSAHPGEQKVHGKEEILEEISTNAALQVHAAVFSLQAGARLLRAEGRTERRSAIHPQRIFTLNTELSVLPVASVQLRPPL